MKVIRVGLLASLLVSLAFAQSNFVYTNDNGTPNTVSGYSVSADGKLSGVPGSPFPTNGSGSPNGTIAISDNLVFASNPGTSDISVFKINPQTGSLTLVNGSPFPTGGFGGSFIGEAPTP
jgi:6-phosphogluconolactonase